MSTPLAMQLRKIAGSELMSERARKRLEKLSLKVEALEIDNGVVTQTLGKMIRRAVGFGQDCHR